MKLVALDSCIKAGLTDVLHQSMFHGVARRVDVTYPNSPSHYLGDPLTHQLLISRSGLSRPHLFKPCNSLVASEQVKNALASLANIEFAPVAFSKLVNFFAPKGDFSYYTSRRFLSNPTANRSDMLLDTLQDDPSLHIAFPVYYELVVSNAFRECRDSHMSFELQYQLPNSPDGVQSFPCTRDFLDCHPIFWARGVIVRGDVYESIKEMIDIDFFDVVTFDA